MTREELTTLIDLILNKADDAQFEVIIKACERRNKDRAMFAKAGGLSPVNTAKSMAKAINESMGATVEGLTGQFRGFIADIILKNQPDISDEDLRALVDAYLPGKGKKASKKPPSKMPTELLAQMTRHFVEFSTGQMAPSKQEELWRTIPDWQNEYWRAFPDEIKAFIDAFLKGRIEEDTFWSATLGFLDL